LRISTIIIVLLASCCNWVNAQSHQVQGVVKDSLGRAINDVFISINTIENLGIAFTKTDSTGHFTITYTDTFPTLYINARALAYKSVQQKLITNQNTYKFTLYPKINELPEVTVNSSSSIIQQGDTIKYNIKTFKQPADKAIIDVIKRLPGIEVDENGVISFNGKAIKNVYVGGDNMVDSRYGLITNNIPVDAITQVQVLQHDQPIKALKEFTHTQDVSLNLKIADSAQLRSINIAQLGGGNKLYYGSFTNLLLKKKVKAINLLNANHTGENLQDENKGLSITSFENLQNTTKPFDHYLSIASHTPAHLEDKYYLQNDDKMGSFNLLFHSRKELSTRLNFSTFQLKRRNEYNFMAQYQLPGNNITYNENQHSTTHSNIWQAAIQVEKNTKQGYLKSITTAQMPLEKTTALTHSNNNRYEQSLRAPLLSISNQTKLIKLGKSKNLFQYNSMVQYYQTNEQLQITPGPLTEIINDTVNYIQLQQKLNTNNFYVNQSINFQKQKGKITYSFLSGINFLHNTFSSTLETLDSANQLNKLGSNFQNDISFNQLDIYTQLEAKFKIKEWQIQAHISPTYQQINYNVKPVSDNKKNKGYFIISPSVSIDKDWGLHSSLHASYLNQPSTGQISDIYQGNIVSDYRSISSNNAALPRIIQNNFSIRYSYKQPLKLFFYNIFASYVQTTKNTINSYIIDSGITKQIAINYHNNSPLLTIGGGASKYLFPLKTNISGNIFYNRRSGYNFNNEQITPFYMNSYTTKLMANKKLFRSGIFLIKLVENIFNSKQSIAPGNIPKTKFRTQSIVINWQHNISENIQYQLSFTAYSAKQGSMPPSRSQFLNFSLQYNPFKWKGYIELKCLNLLNEKKYEEQVLRSNGYSILQMPLRERALLLKYTFNF